MVLGWFWGSGGSNGSQDATKNLDPSLREMLKPPPSQKPPSQPEEQPKAPLEYTQQLRDSNVLLHTKRPTEAEKPRVPPESLYQDGRYADLWKNYEPLSVTETRGETEMDKLKRLSDLQLDKKRRLGKAALENCAFEQWAEMECIRAGSYADRLFMCRPQRKKFSKCYEMNGKFLRALGYFEALGDLEGNRKDEIQMHADKLWQRLSTQDDAIAKAKAEGTPVPTFEGILSPESVRNVGGSLPSLPKKGFEEDDPNYEYPSIPPPLREKFNARIQRMSKEDAKVEEAVYLAEMRAESKFSLEGMGYLREEGDARRKRYETGKATLGDRIKKATGWDQWDSRFPLPADAKARLEQQKEAQQAQEEKKKKS